VLSRRTSIGPYFLVHLGWLNVIIGLNEVVFESTKPYAWDMVRNSIVPIMI
jgi:hypothetical protein